MNKRMRKKRRKSSTMQLKWAIETIKEWVAKIERKIHEDPAGFREVIEKTEKIDPDFKRRMIEYTYVVEVSKTLK